MRRSVLESEFPKKAKRYLIFKLSSKKTLHLQPSMERGKNALGERNSRTIVDPTAWESSEVGRAAEGDAITMAMHGRNNKVSSIRSSLFQKNARGMAEQTGKGTNIDDGAPVFKTSSEAAPLQAPFTFDGSASLAYCDYGKMNKKVWTKDILALVHNAVRSELIDLTTLLLSVQKLGIQLRMRDFFNIRNWWQTCSAVILDFLDLEMIHLMPWFQSALQSSKIKEDQSEKLFESMPARQNDFRDHIMTVSKAFGDLCDPSADNQMKEKAMVSTDKKALLVVNSLDALASKLADYMHEQETKLPSTLSSVYKSEKKERDSIVTKIVDCIAKNARKSEILLVLLTRWMSDSKLAKSFSKTIMGIHECNYSSLQSQLELNHAGFVHQFRVKAKI